MSRSIEEAAPSSRRPLKWFTLIALATALIGSGCATPIGVRYVQPRIAYHSFAANVLSADKPSSFSSRALIDLNLSQRFAEDPQKALAEMRWVLPPKGTADRIF